METKHTCEYCGGNIAFPVEMKGQKTNCPHCNRQITLTGPSSPGLMERIKAFEKNPPSPKKVKAVAALMMVLSVIIAPAGIAMAMGNSNSLSGIYMMGLGVPMFLGAMVLFAFARARE